MSNSTDPRCVMQTARTLPHSPAAVFAAFSDPGQLARWWGPTGFTNTFEVFEFVAQGRWIFHMHGPDGRSYANTSRFDEIEPGRRIVIRHDCAPLFTLTVTLEATDEGTEVHWAQVFDDAQVADAVRAVCGAGNEQNLDRLHTLLCGHSPS